MKKTPLTVTPTYGNIYPHMKLTSKTSRKCVKCGSNDLEGSHNPEDNTVIVSCKFCGFRGVYEAMDTITPVKDPNIEAIIKQVVFSCGEGWRGKPSQLAEKLGYAWTPAEVGKALKVMREEKHPLIQKWLSGCKRNIYVLGIT